MNSSKSLINENLSLNKNKANNNRRTQRQKKKGLQPFSLKIKNFVKDSSIEGISQINIIPKRIRSKNSCSRILLFENLQVNKNKVESESESVSSDSPSREYKKCRVLGDYKNGSIYNYPTKNDVGLYSDDDNCSENSSNEDQNSIDIERILIEIYNKNIKNIHNSNGKRAEKVEIIQGEEHNYDDKHNLYMLKILSTKITELIKKYKEKIYEIKEIKEIYNQGKQISSNGKRIPRRDIQQSTSPSNKSASVCSGKNGSEFNGLTGNYILELLHSFKFLNYSKYIRNKQKSGFNTDDSENEDIETIEKLKNEFKEFGIPKTLLIELKNIKNTLKISTVEIERIFEIPLKILKDNEGNQVHFSIEKMQLEEFSEILLKDNFISSIIENIRLINTQFKVKEINELLNQFSEQSINHQNEMSRFNEYLNNKLMHEDLFPGKGIALTSPSSLESMQDGEQQNNNIIEDIDELVKYINQESDIKKSKKNKNKRNKKNNKHNNNQVEKPNEYFAVNNSCENEVEHEFVNIDDNDDNKVTDQIIEDFKKEIESMSVPAYMTQKIIPNFDDEFLNMLDQVYLAK